MRSVIVNVKLKIPTPNAKTDKEAIIEAENYELPKEYVEDSFKTAEVVEKPHECSWDTIEWECYGNGQPHFYGAGCGETLERNGKCKVCGKTFREVYIQSLIIDEQTGKEQVIF